MVLSKRIELLSTGYQPIALAIELQEEYLVDDVRFELTKPIGTWVTAKHNTPTLSIIHYYLDTLRHGSFTPRRFHNVYSKAHKHHAVDISVGTVTVLAKSLTTMLYALL